jgi:hypothetical protein
MFKCQLDLEDDYIKFSEKERKTYGKDRKKKATKNIVAL